MKKLALLFVLISCAAAQADLKSFFHGSQPSATPGPPDAKAATVSFAPNVTEDKQILDFMQAFAEGLRIHNGDALKPRLSSEYTIEGLPAHMNPVEFFLQAMVKAKAPDEFVITGIEREGDVRAVKIEFRSTERGTKERTFKFEPNGKLISADFFALKVQNG